MHTLEALRKCIHDDARRHLEGPASVSSRSPGLAIAPDPLRVCRMRAPQLEILARETELTRLVRALRTTVSLWGCV
jgi:hypothetical protein